MMGKKDADSNEQAQRSGIAQSSRRGNAGTASLSGARLTVEYTIRGDSSEARKKAEDLCVEQTVEFPPELLSAGSCSEELLGRIEQYEPVPPASAEQRGQAGGASEAAPAAAEHYRALISFPAETAAGELLQLLNVVFGNSSIKPGIRVTALSLPSQLTASFRGPRFGQSGLRTRLGVADRPLICTALKPMGLSAAELAEQAYAFASGGIDIIKDDHGLTDQSFAPFAERLERCTAAVARANRESGGRAVYAPNVTAPAPVLRERAVAAGQAGAGALLLSPFLVGLDSVRAIADDDAVDLPILVHPAFSGSFVTSPDSGIEHGVLYGTVMRLAGADATIFPNYGGRFSFSREECISIADACSAELGGLKPIFPAPGGGMTTDRRDDMLEVYGREFVLLIGGGLHRRGPDLADNARHFVSLIQR